MQTGQAGTLVNIGSGDFQRQAGIVGIKQRHDPEEVNLAIEVRGIDFLGFQHDDLAAQIGDDMRVCLFQYRGIHPCAGAVGIEA